MLLKIACCDGKAIEMTNSPPPDPHSSPKSPLGFDEFIAILVAFSAIGTIFFWAISRKPENLTLFGTKTPPVVEKTPATKLIPDPTQSIAVPSPTVTPLGRRTAVIPIVPTDSEEITPTPSATRTAQKNAIVPVVVPPAAKTKPIAKPIKYSDVPSNFWAAPFIIPLSDRGVFTGYSNGNFLPNKPMTRAEFAVRLDRAFNKAPKQAATNFEDVSSKYWAYDSIKEADINGFVEGYPKNYFRPDKPITRTEAIVALASGLDLKIPPDPDNILQRYKDAAQIPDYAKPKVAAATQAGLVVSSNPQLFKPNQATTRAEAAALLYQGLVKRGRVKPIESKAIVKP